MYKIERKTTGDCTETFYHLFNDEELVMVLTQSEVIALMLKHKREQDAKSALSNENMRKASLAIYQAVGKVEAVKYMNSTYKLGLKDSKDILESWIAEQNNTSPSLGDILKEALANK